MANESTLKKVEAFFLARIVALDSSKYTREKRNDAWRQSEIILSVVESSNALGHLAVDVNAIAAPNTFLARGRDSVDVDGTVWIDARMSVEFCYNLGSDRQQADKSLAQDAAVDIAQAMLREQNDTEISAFGCINIHLIDLFRQPVLTPDGEWLVVSQDYTAAFDLLVRPPDC